MRLLARVDLEERMVSLVVALPRDRFNAVLRLALGALPGALQRRLGVDYHLSLGESDLARIHFTVHVRDGDIPDVSLPDLEQEVVGARADVGRPARGAARGLHGEARGRGLAAAYAARLPDYYKSVRRHLLGRLDIEAFERLDAGEPFVVALQNERGSAGSLDARRPLQVRRQGQAVRLPADPGGPRPGGRRGGADAAGRRRRRDLPARLRRARAGRAAARPRRRAPTASPTAIAAVWRGEAESDSLEPAGRDRRATWRAVAVLRAYRKYRQRVSAGFTEEYQNDAFAANPGIASRLVQLFEPRFDPASDATPRPSPRCGRDPARPRRRALARPGPHPARAPRGRRGHRAHQRLPARPRHLSFKIASAAVPDMPKPYPLFEIFVYAPEMEGIHLRGGRVARGGIRWSDRLEDYRTEILGLMKAQMVKNAVIVPTGLQGRLHPQAPARRPRGAAGGGDAPVRRVHARAARPDRQPRRGQVVHPDDVRVLDDDDPYLVVAADKGTATFSDTANAVSEEVGFWLGDAFASGGSAGYDHKELGITARGAWESVLRHFRELGVDAMHDPVTAVGVGDMSGDVFGNGMLLSPSLRLIAAFDHRHVFIDPDPDAERALAERQRLFELPTSSWADYDAALISPGGGVWSRTREVDPALARGARGRSGVDAEHLPPTDLLRAILGAQVDLLWNGGIGTFVKASSESNADAGDRTTTPSASTAPTCAHASSARAATWLHAARAHRVRAWPAGASTPTRRQLGRRRLLRPRGQPQDPARPRGAARRPDPQAARRAAAGRGRRRRAPRPLRQLPAGADPLAGGRGVGGAAGGLRGPDGGARGRGRPGAARSSTSRRRTRWPSGARPAPAWTGRSSASCWPTPSAASRRRCCTRTCPTTRTWSASSRATSRRRCWSASATCCRAPAEARADRDDRGQRRRQLEGITFVSRTVAETGAEPADVARAYRIAREVTDATPLWDEVEALDGKIDPVAAERADGRRRLARRARGRWYLSSAPGPTSGRPSRRAATASRRSRRRSRAPAPTRGARRARRWPSRSSRPGVSEDFARRHAYLPELVHAPDIVVVARQTGRPLPDVARVFYLLGEALHLDWLEARLDDLPAVSRWQRWAMQAIEDDLTLVRREIALKAIERRPTRTPTRRSRPTWRRVRRRPSGCRGSCAAWRSRASPTSRC